MTDIQIIYDGPIVNKADAKMHGQIKFFTGLPCRRNHIDQRYVVSHECVSCVKKKVKSHAKKNPEMARGRARRYKEKNFPNSARHSAKLWSKNNPQKIAQYRRNRRAKLASADGHHSSKDIEWILNTQKGKCAEPTCRVDLSDGYHVDHIMPISKGGSNWPSNLQCLCQICNNMKHAKLPHEWAREKGRLL